MAETCPLCDCTNTGFFTQDRHRNYFQCWVCRLVFVPPQYHLNAEEEKALYDCHENNHEDSRYREFLSRLFRPMRAVLATGAEGLDFGSGPGPTLSLMFAETGCPTRNYDIFYAPDLSVFARRYDFICSTEVVEHLARPGHELQRLWQCLEADGWLGLMTRRVPENDSFASWHYKNDPTHISFFSRETFVWLGAQWHSTPHFYGDDVVLFKKSGQESSDCSC